MKKAMIISFALLLILMNFVLVGCWRTHVDSTVALSEFIEQGDSEYLSLTIYFLTPSLPIRAPVSVEHLTDYLHHYRITVQGVHMESKIFGILTQLAETELVLRETEMRMCTRIHYVFTTKNGHSIFDVSIGWGDGIRIFVNGQEVKEDRIFHEAIKPFLPASALYNFESFLIRNENLDS